MCVLSWQMLVDEASSNALEYMTLLSTDGTVLVNAGTSNRTGQYWNPEGNRKKIRQDSRI